MLDLTGKVALVMGCGSVAEGWGNGRATAALLARQGARVYGTDLKLENAQVTQKAVEAEGKDIHVEACDVTRAEEVNRVVASTSWSTTWACRSPAARSTWPRRSGTSRCRST